MNWIQVRVSFTRQLDWSDSKPSEQSSELKRLVRDLVASEYLYIYGNRKLILSLLTLDFDFIEIENNSNAVA